MIKFPYKVVPVILVLISCTETGTTDNKPPENQHKPETIEFNPDTKYEVNPITGAPITPLTTKTGDTLETGVNLILTGKKIRLEDTLAPASFKIPKDDLALIENLKTKKKKLSTNLMSTIVNHDSLAFFTLNENTLPYTINPDGDSIPVNTPLDVQLRKEPMTSAELEKTSLPKINENASHLIQHFGTDQGLPSPYIYSLFFDHNQDLWVGTFRSGAYRYDGQFGSGYYTINGTNATAVNSLIQDKKGNFWLGTFANGTIMYDGNSLNYFTKKEGYIDHGTRVIFEDSKGNIWLSGYFKGLSCYNGKTITHFADQQSNHFDGISSITEDRDGNIWFCGDAGAIYYDGKKFTFLLESGKNIPGRVQSIVIDQENNVWIATNNSGICKYDGEKVYYITINDGLSSNSISSLFIDSQNYIWVGSKDQGVDCIKGLEITNYSKQDGLTHNQINAIAEDYSGNIWLGTYGGGINKINLSSFEHYTQKIKLDNNHIGTLVNNSEWYWLAAREEGLILLNEDTIINFSNIIGETNMVLSVFADQENNIWFSRYGQGVGCYDGKSVTYFSEKQGLASNYIFHMLEDKRGNIWFCSLDKGLSSLKGNVMTKYSIEDEFPLGMIYDIKESPDSSIWLSSNKGLAQLTNDSIKYYTEKEGLNDKILVSIETTKNGDTWVGTGNSGLMRITGDSVYFFNKKSGLPSNSIYDIFKDKDENIWLSTLHGISRLSAKGEDIEIHNFDKSDGLQSNVMSLYGSYIDSNNQAWWCGEFGLTKLDLSRFTTSNKVPKPILKQIDINEQSIDFRLIHDSSGFDIKYHTVKKFENYPNHVELPYHKNHLTFYYSAVDWKAPHKIRYSSRIAELNQRWSNPTTDNKVDFKNIPYGRYTFEVCAIGEHGVWSEPVEFPFTITPPWWLALWAKACYTIISIFLILAIINLRTRSLKRKEKVLKERISNATNKIIEQKEKALEQSKLLIIKQKEILDSISYAEKIQSTILPTTKTINDDKYLSNSFIYYRPKDIVAGDFYWVQSKEDKTLFAAADCTGHGVPGALISVVCVNALNRAVREYKLHEPGQILNKVREIVVDEFTKKKDNLNDGMDIALCKIEGKKLSYAGAFNPLWLVRDGEIIEIEADRQPIGKYYNSSPYKTHYLDLEKNDCIYLFSDGFKDQFGGIKGKKFKSSRFRQLILDLQHIEIKKQIDEMNAAFEEWKGELEQVDDVCVLGVKIED